MKTQIYISDLLAEIKLVPGVKIAHFNSADVIYKNNENWVIYSNNGLWCSLTYYANADNYINHIGAIIADDITYKSALSQVLKIVKGINNG